MKNTNIEVINTGIVMGNIESNVNQTQTGECEILKNCIKVITNDYAPVNDMEHAEMALTTTQLRAQIAAFCGVDFPLMAIFQEMTNQGFTARYSDSLALGLEINFYWLFSKK